MNRLGGNGNNIGQGNLNVQQNRDNPTQNQDNPPEISYGFDFYNGSNALVKGEKTNAVTYLSHIMNTNLERIFRAPYPGITFTRNLYEGERINYKGTVKNIIEQIQDGRNKGSLSKALLVVMVGRLVNLGFNTEDAENFVKGVTALAQHYGSNLSTVEGTGADLRRVVSERFKWFGFTGSLKELSSKVGDIPTQNSGNRDEAIDYINQAVSVDLSSTPSLSTAVMVNQIHTQPTRTRVEMPDNTYVQSGNPGITPANITFIHNVVRVNPEVFSVEMITHDDFDDALNIADVSFLRQGTNYVPFYRATVLRFIADNSRFPYRNTQGVKRENLAEEDLISLAALLADINGRIANGELKSPYNESK